MADYIGTIEQVTPSIDVLINGTDTSVPVWETTIDPIYLTIGDEVTLSIINNRVLLTERIGGVPAGVGPEGPPGVDGEDGAPGADGDPGVPGEDGTFPEPTDVQMAAALSPTSVYTFRAIRLSWNDTLLNTAGWYEVELATNSGFTTGLVTRITRDNQWVFGDITPNDTTTYYTRVRPVRTAGAGTFVAAASQIVMKIQNADINTVSATKLTAGDITVAIDVAGSSGILRSSNYVAGDSGWSIDGDGDAEFNSVTIRGTLNTIDDGTGTGWVWTPGASPMAYYGGEEAGGLLVVGEYLVIHGPTDVAVISQISIGLGGNIGLLTDNTFTMNADDVVVNGELTVNDPTYFLETTAATLVDNSGAVIVGASGSTQIGIDDTSLQARNAGASAALQLQRYGGNIVISSTAGTGAVQIRSSAEATLTNNSGALTVGTSGAQQLGVDANEIQSRDGIGGSASLLLNPHGGDVLVGGVSVSVAGHGHATDPITITTQAGTTYTFVLADAGTEVEFTSSTAVTLTVPLNGTAAFPVGTVINIVQRGLGQITIVPDGAVVLNSPDGALKTRVRYGAVTLIKRATNSWQVNGDLTV